MEWWSCRPTNLSFCLALCPLPRACQTLQRLALNTLSIPHTAVTLFSPYFPLSTPQLLAYPKPHGETKNHIGDAMHGGRRRYENYLPSLPYISFSFRGQHLNYFMYLTAFAKGTFGSSCNRVRHANTVAVNEGATSLFLSCSWTAWHTSYTHSLPLGLMFLSVNRLKAWCGCRTGKRVRFCHLHMQWSQ